MSHGHGADFQRISGKSVGEVNLPATFEVVDVHDDFGFASRQIDRFAKENHSRADLSKFDSLARNLQMELYE